MTPTRMNYGDLLEFVYPTRRIFRIVTHVHELRNGGFGVSFRRLLLEEFDDLNIIFINDQKGTQ